MKKLTVLLVLALLLSALLPSAWAETDPPAPAIIAHNVSFKDNVYLLYAVDCDGCSDVKLLVWDQPQDEYVHDITKCKVLSPSRTETVDGIACNIYYYTDLIARQMTEDVYACAYVDIDGTAYYSTVVRYSILDYAHTMLNRSGTSEKLKNVLSAMLNYGAAAQIYYNGGEGYRLDRLADADYHRVTVKNGTLSDGFSSYLYLPGATATLKADTAVANGTNDGYLYFDHWEDSSGSTVGTKYMIDITVSSSDETYSPVYVVIDNPFELTPYRVNEYSLPCYKELTQTQIEDFQAKFVNHDEFLIWYNAASNAYDDYKNKSSSGGDQNLNFGT